ncbi:MAG: hypothetical protein PWQ89_705 [Verrucomicrobiota bacterium]|jgi:hypothetical protein|nr:hypothetical protein [Verrucomicrobiota bacterium]
MIRSGQQQIPFCNHLTLPGGTRSPSGFAVAEFWGEPKRARRARSTWERFLSGTFPPESRLSLLPCFFPTVGKIETFSNAWKNLLNSLFTESKSLESEIKNQLRGLRYE